MKNILTTTATLAIAGISLTGCVSPGEPGSGVEESPAPESASPSEEPAAATTSEASESEAEPAPEADADAGDDMLSVGDTVDLESVGAAGLLTLEEVTPAFECTRSQSSHVPNSGEFIALTVSLEGVDDRAAVNSEDFYLVDDQGNLTDITQRTAPYFACVETPELLAEARPGTTATGYVLLDSDLEAGTLVYEGSDGDVRWQF